MTDLDIFKIEINPFFKVNSMQVKGLCIAEIYINHESLIELVRQAEIPFIQAEIKERRAEGDDIDEITFPPGDYNYLSPSEILLPSRNFLDEPEDCGFTLEPDNPAIGKTTILECSCGNPGCWFMQVRITLNESTVIWSEFTQFHRDWELDLGLFTFDRKQYESELSKPNYE
ncbi:MAG: hypothetical protein AAFX46_03220 [Cyanobacteria bacterium J06636_27]